MNQGQHQKHLSWAQEEKNWTIAQRSKVFFLDKNSFSISFGNQESEEAQNRSKWKSRCSFPAGLCSYSQCHSCNRFADHGITVLNCWVGPEPEPRENLLGIVKEKMRDTRARHRWAESRYQSNLCFLNTPAVSEADCLPVTLHWYSDSCKRNPDYGVQKWTFVKVSSSELNYPTMIFFTIFNFFEMDLYKGTLSDTKKKTEASKKESKIPTYN